jgi:preprotein translocase subunit SecE
MAGRPAAKRTGPRRDRTEGKGTAIPPVGQKTTITSAPEPSGPSIWSREGMSSYLHQVRLEMGRVTWPTRRELQAATLVVLMTLIVFSAYLGFWDQILKRLLP